MKNEDYSVTISAQVSPHDAFEKIANVNEWWAKHFKGKALQKGDTFTVTFGTTWVTFQISDSVKDKSITWHVTDCYLAWLNDKTEWNGTDVVWEILPEKNNTIIKMKHVGLVPQVECYNDCVAGWDKHVKGSLLKLLNENEGEPQ